VNEIDAVPADHALSDELTRNTRDFWLDVGRATARDSVKTLDETAGQVIVVAGVLEGLYFHAIAYSDLRGQVSGGTLAIYGAPVVLLLLSLVAALLILLPARYRLNVPSAQAVRLLQNPAWKHAKGLVQLPVDGAVAPAFAHPPRAEDTE
jgi:hypothetical protein